MLKSKLIILFQYQTISPYPKSLYEIEEIYSRILLLIVEISVVVRSKESGVFILVDEASVVLCVTRFVDKSFGEVVFNVSRASVIIPMVDSSESSFANESDVVLTKVLEVVFIAIVLCVDVSLKERKLINIKL